MRRPRTPSRISESLHRQLNAYALAASAAGVGILALAQPAEGKIVYTHAHRNIGSKTFLDLNHDGVNDFKFVNARTSRCVGECTTGGVIRHGTAFQATYAELNIYGLRSGNQMFGQSRYASAFSAGVRVGPSGKFPGGNIMASAMAISGNNEYSRGPWAGTEGGGVKHRYLGLKFAMNGKTHYGWARLNVVISQAATIKATLTGYAYETVPNKPIITGRTKGPDVITLQDASLGHLARGSSAISAWRVEEAK